MPFSSGFREHNLQVWVEVIASAELLAPVGLLEDLVNKQHASAIFHEVTCKISNTAILEIEVVHVDVKTLAVFRVEIFLRILQQECRFADPLCL